ncbi:MAG: Ig-like domain-containing protein, partial [Clostridia bacterium]|nr:Ig-like domain-containing protein [Clostridia bacterium]
TVSADDKLDKVTVKTASPVQFYNFTSGVVLPNNGIWFKPSIAGKIRLVMYSENAGDGFSLIQGHRTSATKEDPFIIDYSQSGGDITVREIAKCGLPSRVLFYFEYDISQEEIDDGRYEYWILQNDGGGTGKDPGGAYFVYLDLGAAAAEDSSAVVPDKVSAVDFIYDGVEISQEDVADTDIKIGDFIVNVSGAVARYNSSKTSVYFDNITKILKVVYVRLNNDDKQGHSGKTMCLEFTPTSNLDEVYATYATYVCPTIKGGSGTVGGGGGTGTPDPVPDTPTVTEVAVTPTTATVTAGETTNLTASVTMSDGSEYGGNVAWTSSDETVATVSNGVVTTKKAGTVTITATAGGKSSTATITVEAADAPTPSGKPQKWILSTSNLSSDNKSITYDCLTVTTQGGNEFLSASYAGTMGTGDDAVTWTNVLYRNNSSDPLVITSSKKVKITVYTLPCSSKGDRENGTISATVSAGSTLGDIKVDGTVGGAFTKSNTIATVDVELLANGTCTISSDKRVGIVAIVIQEL